MRTKKIKVIFNSMWGSSLHEDIERNNVVYARVCRRLNKLPIFKDYYFDKVNNYDCFIYRKERTVYIRTMVNVERCTWETFILHV